MVLRTVTHGNTVTFGFVFSDRVAICAYPIIFCRGSEFFRPFDTLTHELGSDVCVVRGTPVKPAFVERKLVRVTVVAIA